MIVWAVGLGVAFLWWHLRRNEGWRKRRARFRIRRPEGAPLWITIATVSSLGLVLGVAGVIDAFAPPFEIGEDEIWSRWEHYQRLPAG